MHVKLKQIFLFFDKQFLFIIMIHLLCLYEIKQLFKYFCQYFFHYCSKVLKISKD